jgi:MHS family shikimate/dehydroshikimate transporter-like MFS transporter
LNNNDTLTADETTRKQARTVVLASFIGTSIEWYDFFLYGTAAALVFNRLFFPSESPVAGTLASFAVFAAGFVARPIGGIIFGHFGDRIGRKSVLIWTLLLMGGSTVLMGALPSFDQVGVLAPVLLVTLRLIQGLALGGEWGGAILMSTEHAPAKKRGLYGSWPNAGAPLGLLLATGAFAAVSQLSPADFDAYGWRIPFLASSILIVVGLVIRLRVAESPAFEKVKERGEVVRVPIVDAIRYHWRNILLALGVCMAPLLTFYMFATFGITYGTLTLGLNRNDVLMALSIAAACEVATIPLFAHLSDRIGRRKVFIFGAGLLGLLAFPLFALMDTGNVFAYGLAVFIGLVIVHAPMFGPIGAMFVEMFSARSRYSGASLGYQLGGIIGGGFAPLILTALLASTGGKSWIISVYMIFAAVITVVCTLLLRINKPDLATVPDSAPANTGPTEQSEPREAII